MMLKISAGRSDADVVCSRCSPIQVAAQHQLQHADDAVHRRANFATYGGEEYRIPLPGSPIWPAPSVEDPAPFRQAMRFGA